MLVEWIISLMKRVAEAVSFTGLQGLAGRFIKQVHELHSAGFHFIHNAVNL